MTFVTPSRADDAGLTARVADLLTGLRLAMARRRVYRQTLRELRAMTSRELAELGIHRSMITRMAAEVAYGK